MCLSVCGGSAQCASCHVAVFALFFLNKPACWGRGGSRVLPRPRGWSNCVWRGEVGPSPASTKKGAGNQSPPHPSSLLPPSPSTSLLSLSMLSLFLPISALARFVTRRNRRVWRILYDLISDKIFVLLKLILGC